MQDHLTEEGYIRFIPENDDDRKFLARLHHLVRGQHEEALKQFREGVRKPRGYFSGWFSTPEKELLAMLPEVDTKFYHDQTLVLQPTYKG